MFKDAHERCDEPIFRQIDAGLSLADCFQLFYVRVIDFSPCQLV